MVFRMNGGHPSLYQTLLGRSIILIRTCEVRIVAADWTPAAPYRNVLSQPQRFLVSWLVGKPSRVEAVAIVVMVSPRLH